MIDFKLNYSITNMLNLLPDKCIRKLEDDFFHSISSKWNNIHVISISIFKSKTDDIWYIESDFESENVKHISTLFVLRNNIISCLVSNTKNNIQNKIFEIALAEEAENEFFSNNLERRLKIMILDSSLDL